MACEAMQIFMFRHQTNTQFDTLGATESALRLENFDSSIRVD